MSGGPPKMVWHKTQGGTLAGALGAYTKNGTPPHFTIAENGDLHQHVDTTLGSYALRNLSGGVQTNLDGVVQVEVVGFSGTTAWSAQLVTMRELFHWAESQGVAPVWPAGRPPRTSAEGYGQTKFRASNELWDNTSGHYGHSQVPENAHWDPAWTDDEWRIFVEPQLPIFQPISLVTPVASDNFKERVMAKPVLKEGAKGHDVVILQSLLIGHDRGAVAYVTQGRTAFDFVDGDFGPSTTAVLKHWQTATGELAVDGICGPAVWAWLVGV